MTTEAAPFEKIAEHYRSQIVSGSLKPGDKLPTVRQISETWDVARQTANRAIERLRNEELVVTSGRRGTVVAGGEVRTVALALDGLGEVDIESVNLKVASEKVANELGVTPGTSILILKCRASRSQGSA